MKNTTQRTAKIRRYNKRKKAGVCVGCGKVAARTGLATCAACGKRSSIATGKWAKRRMPALKRFSVCISCHVNEAVPKRVLCGFCAERRVETQKERRDRYKSEGRCPICGGQRETENRSWCDGCRASHRAQAGSRARLKTQATTTAA